MKFIVNPQKSQQKTVTLYKNKNFSGPSQKLIPGVYSIMQLSLGDGGIGSLKIPEYMLMTMYYKDSDDSVEKKTFIGEVTDTEAPFRDKVSAIAIQFAVKLYGERDYQGKGLYFPVGKHKISDQKITKGSVRVIKGLAVTFFENPDFTGNSVSFTEDTPFIGDRLEIEPAGFIVEALKTGDLKGVVNFGNTVAFKFDEKKFIRVQTDQSLIAESESIEKENEFTIVSAGSSRLLKQVSFGDCVSFKTQDDKYLSVDEDGKLLAKSDTIADQEKFIIWRSGDTQHMGLASSRDTISLQSCANNKFVNSQGTI
ncbi:MAG: hypothetical protein HN417_11630, partial [Desulfobacula sp.]|nr:hypothetical protein [Desulfobacula sp.]